MLTRIVISGDSVEDAVARMKAYWATEATPEKPEVQIDPRLVDLGLVLPIERMEIVIRAIDASGNKHRGEALVAICEFYLKERKNDENKQ